MKCDRCFNDAFVHVSERRPDGTVADTHLCGDCAGRDDIPGHGRRWITISDEEIAREIDRELGRGGSGESGT